MTFLAILKVIWNFIKTHWRAILIGTAILIVLAYVAGISSYCSPQPKIDIETVDKINSKNAAEAHQALEKAVNENLDAIKSADENTKLSDLDIETRQKEADKKVEELDKKVQEAKEQGHDVTQQDLECMLVPERCQ